MTSARTKANLLAGAGVMIAATLYRFSPRDYSFYPRCPYFALTGHYCPGCGATRAVAELLHGHFAAALQFNAAVTLLTPFLLCFFLTMYWTAVRENRIEWPQVPGWSWKLAVSFVALFGIARMLTQGTF